jgi:subtilisin family serine protease
MKFRTSLLFAMGLAVALVMVGCSDNQTPTSPQQQNIPNGKGILRTVPEKSRVPGAYIVVLKETTNNVWATVEEMSHTYKMSVDRVYSSALQGFAARMDDADLNALLGDPRIEYIEQDQTVTIDAQALPWGIDATGDDSSSTLAGDGTGTVSDVRIYIIDTGIDINHPDLNVVGGRNFVTGSRTYDDGNGHGTHVAGTAAAIDDGSGVVGMAPGASLYAVRVLNNKGSGTTSGVIAGVDWVRQEKQNNPWTPMAANMSLGGGASASLDLSVSNCINAGVVVCVAAGNSGVDAGNSSPARVAATITVGAHDISNVLASWSNYGSMVDINAPGVSITSTYKGGGYAIMSGTSMATPHVTGAAALYLSTHRTSTPAQVRDAIVNDGAAWVTHSRANTTTLTLRTINF